jgi:hypothetical protein
MPASMWEILSGAASKKYLDGCRFFGTSINFILSAVFVFILLANAFTMEEITGPQVFHTDRVLQSYQTTQPTQMDAFAKQAYGLNTEILDMASEITILPEMLPHMYEVSGSNSMLRLDAVHCNFMLFSAMWIASAFALTMTSWPMVEPLMWSHMRVMIVHIWNLIGLILTIVIFTATTKWSDIPTSNLFYALVGQTMAWMYQYFHMVECTQCFNGNLRIVHKPAGFDTIDTMLSSSDFSTEMRKLIYMEFSVVVPMLLVASLMPGVIGIDEWRIQTILFSSWTLFALLGLHLRFRKSLVFDKRTDASTSLGNPSRGLNVNFETDQLGLDALGYLTYAIVLVYIMLINAMGTVTFTDPLYATARIIQCRWGARILIIVSGTLVVETIYKAVMIRFFRNWVNVGKVQVKNDTQPDGVDWWMLPSFMGNALIIGFGSVLVKILIFSGVSDVNGLSTWYL